MHAKSGHTRSRSTRPGIPKPGRAGVAAARSGREGLAQLRKDVEGTAPEDVNDGAATTAPSKRLKAAIPSYQKTTHGPLVAEQVGLTKLRARCTRFSTWVEHLEALGE
jgi:hypothetical protein